MSTKYRGEQNPAAKNSLKAQMDELLADIGRIEQEIKSIEQKLKSIATANLVEILKLYFEADKKEIIKGYRCSLPKRLIAQQTPQSLESLINGLQLPKPPEETYSYLEKFVGNLLLGENSSNLKQELNEWAEENIKNCQQLLERLRQEQEEQQSCPGLLVAISEREGRYVVEAWLIEDLDKYDREIGRAHV